MAFIKTATGRSSKFTANYTQFASQLVIDNINQTNERISGPGIEVQVDKSLFSKKKYYWGTVSCANLGFLVALKSLKRFFCSSRRQSYRKNVGSAHRCVHQHGFILKSDCWKGYSQVLEKGLDAEHFFVNCLQHYKGSVTGKNTNNIEDNGEGLKNIFKECGTRTSLVIFIGQGVARAEP